jgi:hypothetical protein
MNETKDMESVETIYGVRSSRFRVDFIWWRLTKASNDDVQPILSPHENHLPEYSSSNLQSSESKSDKQRQNDHQHARRCLIMIMEHYLRLGVARQALRTVCRNNVPRSLSRQTTRNWRHVQPLSRVWLPPARNLHNSSSSRRRNAQPPDQPPPTDFDELNILGDIPTPATSIDVCVSDGFHLNSGAKILGGNGVILVGGEAFAWRPWLAKGSKTLVNSKGQWDVPADAFGVLDILWPRPGE